MSTAPDIQNDFSHEIIGAAVEVQRVLGTGLDEGAYAAALAIELAYEGAQSLHHRGFNAHAAWAFISAGFAAGAVIYYSTSLFLEKKRGCTLRHSVSRICPGAQTGGCE